MRLYCHIKKEVIKLETLPKHSIHCDDGYQVMYYIPRNQYRDEESIKNDLEDRFDSYCRANWYSVASIIFLLDDVVLIDVVDRNAGRLDNFRDKAA